jgi:DNA modification methylase
MFTVEQRPLESIRPYENNPRRNDGAVDAVAKSIREFGFRQPIVVDEDGVIIAGHVRFKAAHKLDLPAVPVHVAVGLTAAQVKAYRVADNQTATLAQWDDDRLVREILDLQRLQFDLNITGFSAEDILRLTAPTPTVGFADPDAIPEWPDQPVTQSGDVWVLGCHRLLCGDSAKADDVDRLLDGAPVHLVHTDPPYGVHVEPRSAGAIAAGLSSFEEPCRAGRGPSKASTRKKLRPRDRPLVNDFTSDEEFTNLLKAWFGNAARVLLPGRSFYAWGGYSNLANYPVVLQTCGLYFSQAIIWVKEHPVLTRKDYMGNFELAFYGWKQGAAHRFFGPNNVTDVWSVKKVNPQQMIHLTEKPVELAARAIEYSSRLGEHILDLFGGSGSTLIAAERAGRKAFVMEIDAHYCDLIVRRWETFTGKKAEKR